MLDLHEYSAQALTLKINLKISSITKKIGKMNFNIKLKLQFSVYLRFHGN